MTCRAAEVLPSGRILSGGSRSNVELDPEHAIANVSFPATLGHSAKFGNIVIEGVSAARRATPCKQSEDFFRPGAKVAIRPGKTYHYSTMTKATSYLQTK